jgi:GTP-binding protein
MIDTVRININAGNGGNGCASFLREKYKPKGGPNGGDGGNGGSAYVCGDPALNTLLHLKFNSTVYVAGGGHGRGKDQHGANGVDKVIKVPIGTEVSILYPDGEKELLADIVDDNPHMVARGGRGGWGNAHYVSSTNREPVLMQRGEPGESVVLFLELKLLADVGLVARPNAGKSTLIARCSSAKPKIADYPFTTVEPVLGVVRNRERDFVMMEVPGLLEGAHEGVGLGQQFLRHAERARLYVYLVDGLSDNPAADYQMLNEELFSFNAKLLEKPRLIAVNKVDVTEVREGRDRIYASLRGTVDRHEPPPFSGGSIPIFFISAATGEGVDELLGKIVELLQRLPKEATDLRSMDTPGGSRRPHREPDAVYVENGVFVVQSWEIERLASLADTRDPRVLLQLWQELKRRGLSQKLEAAGVEAGDTLRIGKVEVEWF